MDIRHSIQKYSPIRILRYIAFQLAKLPMISTWRAYLVHLGGVQIFNCSTVHIGEGVIFDSMYPQDIILHDGVHITMGTIILSHYMDPSKKGFLWNRGKVEILDNAFIGARTVICNSVTIGKNSFIAAGSVVTKSIPDQ